MAGEIITDTTKHLSDLTPNTTYTYTVTAKGDGVNTLDSEAATGTFTTLATTLATPSGLDASNVTDTEADITWEPVEGAVGYEVDIAAVPKLDAPANLAVDDVDADAPTSSSFTVKWDEVADASGYTATASADGEGEVPGAVAGTVASFSSLTADTAYTVSVVATGDGTTHTDSPAATLDVSTTAA